MEVKWGYDVHQCEKKQMDVTAFIETKTNFLEKKVDTKIFTVSDYEKKLLQVAGAEQAMSKKFEEQETKIQSLEKIVCDLKANMVSQIASHVQRHIQLVKTDLNRKIESNSDKIIRIERKAIDSEHTLIELVDNDVKRKAKLSGLEKQIEGLKINENQTKIEGVGEPFQRNPSGLQDEEVQRIIKQLDRINNIIDESKAKMAIVEKNCKTISVSVDNIKDEIEKQKSNLPAESTNSKLQEIEKRLQQVDFRFSLLDYKQTII